MLALEHRIETVLGSVFAGRRGEGPPLLLLHGWPWSSVAWHRVVAVLARTYTVHFHDMPGFGKSITTRKGVATGLDGQTEALNDILDYWDFDKPPLVLAHDFGGAIALRAHLLTGRDLAGLVLMNVVALSPWGSDFFDLVGRNTEVFEKLPAHIHEAILRAYIKGALANDIADEDFEALVAPWLGNEGRAAFYRQFAQADDALTDEFFALLNTVRCPTRVIWGADDPWIPLERGRRLAQLIGQGELREMEGVGHLPQLENPTMTAKIIADTLQTCAK